jgi:hypothetical protein
MADDAGDGRANAMADAILASALMEETAQYLSRGRQFKTTSEVELKLRWAEALRRWIKTHSAGNVRQLDDLSAELRLRGMGSPEDSVKAELSSMVDEIRRDCESDPECLEEIAKRIAEFRMVMDKPSS